MDLLQRTPVINLDTSFEEACRILDVEPEFRALSDRRTRERLFFRYIDDLEVRHREEEKKRIQKNMEEFKQVLESRSDITGESQWREIRQLLRDEPSLKNLDEAKAIRCFEDHIKVLREREKVALHLERERKKRDEKSARDNFRVGL